MQTYTAREMLSPQNSQLLDEIILLLSYTFTDDVMDRWLLGERNRKAYIAALPVYHRFVVQLALLSDASVLVVPRNDKSPASKETKEVKQGVQKNSKEQLQIHLPRDFTIQAVAITIPPHGNANFDSTMTSFRAGALGLPFRLGLSFTHRFLVGWLPRMHKMYHQDVYADPSIKYTNHHLLFLAVHPDAQGRGLGKKILLELQNTVRVANVQRMQEAKATGQKLVPNTLYLEASNTSNKRLYARMGFELRATFVYGELDEGEDLNLAEDGMVLGGRQFGMVWTPGQDTAVDTVQQK